MHDEDGAAPFRKQTTTIGNPPTARRAGSGYKSSRTTTRAMINPRRISPAFHHSPFTPANQRGSQAFHIIKQAAPPQNLRLNGAGLARLLIPQNFEDALKASPSFGKTLISTCNRAVSICVNREYPKFVFRPQLKRALDPAGSLAFQVSPQISLAVIRQTLLGETTLGLEWSDENGSPIHRCHLTTESNWSAFIHYAQHTQILTGPAPGRSACSSEQRRISRRSWMNELVVRKQRTINQNPRFANPTSSDALLEDLNDVVEDSRQMTATIYTDSVLQSQTFAPGDLEADKGWIAIGDEHTRLRIDVNRVAELWRVRFRLNGRIINGYEAYDESERILFALVPGQVSSKDWRAAAAAKRISN